MVGFYLLNLVRRRPHVEAAVCDGSPSSSGGGVSVLGFAGNLALALFSLNFGYNFAYNVEYGFPASPDFFYQARSLLAFLSAIMGVIVMCSASALSICNR